MNSRSSAAHILQQVLAGQSLSQAIKSIKHPDMAFIHEICFGVMRQLSHLQGLLAPLLKKPLKQKDDDIYSLLLMGIYQMEFMRVPDHAAISESVSAVKPLNKTWAKALVNGVLRNYQRQKDDLHASLSHNEPFIYAHPQWLIDTIRQDWPEHWQSILAANNQQAPLTLRVCEQHIQTEQFLGKLHDLNIQAQLSEVSPQAILVHDRIPIESLPGYAQGWFYVQDGAAQLAAPLLNVQAGMRVLDACSAPGGKALHILDMQPKLDRLDMVESSPVRLEKIRENGRRYGLHQDKINILLGDGAFPQKWWGKELYHRILLDVPCSGTGVIRRKPDIKYHRQPKQLLEQVKTQQQLLKGLWPLLHKGGYLLYCTCSMLKQENNKQMHWFLSEFKDALVHPLHLPIGQALDVGHQILTNDKGMDGFYYACLEKTT